MFFITGLPRSRTGWLSNFLTTGKTFCFHDGLLGCESIYDLADKMDRMTLSYDSVGNSDSGLGFVWENVVRTFPAARTVFVWRDRSDALVSYLDYFSRSPYRGMKNLSKSNVLFTELDRQLRKWRREVTTNALDVEFDDLNKPGTVQRIQEFVSTEKFDLNRWNLLDGLRVNPASEKISLEPEKIQKLIHERLVEA